MPENILIRELSQEFARPVLKDQSVLGRVKRQARVHLCAFDARIDDDKLDGLARILERKINLLNPGENRPDGETEPFGRQGDLFDNAEEPQPPTRGVPAENLNQRRHRDIADHYLACLQISEIAALRRFDKTTRRLKRYRASTWVAEQIQEARSAAASTFLLSVRLERLMRHTRKHALLPAGLAAQAISEALTDMKDVLPAGFMGGVSIDSRRPMFRDVQTGGSFDQFGKIFEDIAHEICENALSHGVHSEINLNRYDHPEDFGRIFVFETRTKRVTWDDALEVNIALPGFRSFFLFNTGIGQRRKDYRILSFFDTGMGIEQHLAKYGNDGAHVPAISDIARENLSSRSQRGSGHGLSNMMDLAGMLKAFLAITTSEGTFTFDGASKKERIQGGRDLPRGTLISLYLPARP